MNIKAVIGANYGDEGKGTVTNNFCKHFSNGIVVCSNGGSQRGHTVVCDNDVKHTFRHFGSGVFHNCHTYFPEKYIVNPMTFVKEYNELQHIGFTPVCYINSNCLVTTPFDMLLNQLLENSRGDNRHGSVGVGIWETIVRNDLNRVTFADLSDYLFLEDYLFWVRDCYFVERLKKYNLNLSEELKNIFFDDDFIRHYKNDFMFMKLVCNVVDNNLFLKNYNDVCFENGQGLLLDQDLNNNGIHCTPSNTGIKNVKEIIDEIKSPGDNIEVCYVSRTYLTRHGNGEFDDKDFSFVDENNLFNKYQGSLRYSYLDINSLKDRIFKDFNCADNDYKLSIALTHMDEIPIDLKTLGDSFSKVYCSFDCKNVLEV